MQKRNQELLLISHCYDSLGTEQSLFQREMVYLVDTNRLGFQKKHNLKHNSGHSSETAPLRFLREPKTVQAVPVRDTMSIYCSAGLGQHSSLYSTETNKKPHKTPTHLKRYQNH